MKFALALGILGTVAPALAGHSRAARFDRSVEEVSLAERAPAPPACPSGYKFVKVLDQFNGSISKNFVFAAGSPANVKFVKGGGVNLVLSKKVTTVVLATKLKWLPGSLFTVYTKPPKASGIVTSFVFNNNASSDSVNLEFVGNNAKSIQTAIYSKGRKITSDVSPFNDINTQSATHQYQIRWSAKDVKLSVDAAVARTATRSSGTNTPWAVEPLTFKFGPYSPGGYAGALNYTANPSPTVFVQAVSIQGCAK